MVTPSEMKLLYFPPGPLKASSSHLPQEHYSSANRNAHASLAQREPGSSNGRPPFFYCSEELRISHLALCLEKKLEAAYKEVLRHPSKT